MAKVEFYLGSRKLGEDLTSPYSLSWNTTGTAGGAYELSAQVTDTGGGLVSSSLRVVQLVEGNVSTLFYRGLNLNGSALTLDGNAWEAAPTLHEGINYSTNGTALSNSSMVLSPSTDAARESMLRSGVRGYNHLELTLSAIPAGSYQVFPYTAAYSRQPDFSLLLNNQTAGRNLSTGPEGSWQKRGPYQVNLTGSSNTLKLEMNEGAGLAGLELRRITGPDNLPPVAGLKAYWPFSSAGTLGTDASGNGNTGTLYSGPSWVAGGRVGGSLEAADNTGRWMNVPGLTWQPANFTVAWWHYPESYNIFNQQMVAPSGLPDGWSAFVFHTTSDGGVYVGTDVATRLTPAQLPAGTMKLYQWQHFAFTWENGTGRFYRNGTLLAEKTGMTAPVAWNGFRIGANTPEMALHGMVDEVRIYDRALTADEVTRTADYFTATTCTWKPDAATTVWNTASNWVEGKVPTSNDDVIVNTCTNCPVLPGNVRLNNLTLNTSSKIDLQAYTAIMTNSTNLEYAIVTGNNGRIISAQIHNVYQNIFNGTLTLEKNGPHMNVWSGGNTFNGVTTINLNNAERGFYSYSYLRTGNSLPDVFNEEAYVNHLNGIGLVVAFSHHPSLTTVFKKKLTITSYGVAGPHNVRCEGEVVLNAPGAGEISSGGNKVDFLGPVTLNLINSGRGNAVSFINCTFSAPVIVNSPNQTYAWVHFGNSYSQCLFTPTASLAIGPEGFYKGELLLTAARFRAQIPPVWTFQPVRNRPTVLVI